MSNRVLPPGMRNRACIKYVAITLLVWASPLWSFDHDAWDGLLKGHVRTDPSGHATWVDYAGMRRDAAQLDAYLTSLANVRKGDFANWPREEQLAFLINAYNAWTVALVLSGPPDLASIKDLGSLWRSPWGRPIVTLFGATLSLDDIEHGLIRGNPAYAEPRIHFAVNCASIGCPALREEAYGAGKLEAQLEEQTRRFLADRSRNRIQNGALMVSRLFDWYDGDFAHAGSTARGVVGFLLDYADALGLTHDEQDALRRNEMRISYTTYDWRINALSTAVVRGESE